MKTIELRADLRVELSVLTPREEESADRIIGSILGEEVTPGALALVTSKTYTVCSIRKINDTPVAPLAGGVVYDSVRDRFTGRELRELMGAYSDLAEFDPADVKNGSSAEASAT